MIHSSAKKQSPPDSPRLAPPAEQPHIALAEKEDVPEFVPGSFLYELNEAQKEYDKKKCIEAVQSVLNPQPPRKLCTLIFEEAPGTLALRMYQPKNPDFIGEKGITEHQEAEGIDMYAGIIDAKARRALQHEIGGEYQFL